MSWTSWPLKFWSNEQTVLDLKKVYLKVEFLTQEEKIKKDDALTPLLQQAENDPDTLIPYEDHYKVLFNNKLSVHTVLHSLPLRKAQIYKILKSVSSKSWPTLYYQLMNKQKTFIKRILMGLN